jgi:adenylate kinase
VDCVPYIFVQPEVLIERLSGRWTCRAEGHVYHEKYNPSKTAGKCDVDGSELYQRDDDKPATVENRIRVYMSQTSPLIEYYRQKGLLAQIDGTQPIEKVTGDLLAAINKGK